MNTTTPAATPDTPDTTPPLQVTGVLMMGALTPGCTKHSGGWVRVHVRTTTTHASVL